MMPPKDFRWDDEPESKTMYARLIAYMVKLHRAKGADYSGEPGGQSNLDVATEIGLAPWEGVFVRLMDKQQRGRVLLKKLRERGEGPEIKTEPLIVTLIDEAVYCLLEVEKLIDAGLGKFPKEV
jgi:hypothetical protein